MKHYYKVAEHIFSVDIPEESSLLDKMGQYAPFSVSESDHVVFSLRLVEKDVFPQTDNITTEMNQDDDGSQILAGLLHGKPYFEFQLWGRCAARMVTDDLYQHADVLLVDEPLFGINNALMVMYALSTANLQTALFHSSVVSCAGYGYMFLGKSGTGKSTHSRTPDGFYVFGSPWSGKTPCYRNVRYPLGGVVQLSQAPYNKIQRLKPLMAYAALVPSISGKRWDKQVAEGLHETEDMMASEVAVWHLECLPDADAAQLCSKTIRKA